MGAASVRVNRTGLAAAIAHGTVGRLGEGGF